MPRTYLTYRLCAAAAMVLWIAARVMAESVVPPDGIAAEGEKRWDDAVRIYRSAIESDPTRGDLWIRIAQIEASLGHREPAADALRKASDLAPTDASLQSEVAGAYSVAGKPAQALEAVNRALAVDPKNLDYLRACALYANWAGKPEVAVAAYQRILAITPGDEKALTGLQGAVSVKGKLPDREALAEATQKAAALRPQDAPFQFRAAQAYSLAEKPAKALEAVDRALAPDPKNLEYLRARAVYANWLGNSEAVAATCKRILAIVPNDEKALAGLQGAVASSSKHADHEAVAELLEKKAATRPKDAALQYQLTQSYSMANKPEKALVAIEKAVKLDPKNTEYLLARGQCANWLGKTDIAEDSYRRIVALSPRDANALLNLGRAQAWGGGLDASVRSFKKYRKQRPEDKEALLQYISVQSWRGNYSAAMEALDEYKQRFGETMDYRKQKARILASADRPAAALEMIPALLKDSSNDYEVVYSQAQALHNARRNREALDSLAVLESLRPESKDTEDMRRVVTANTRDSVKGAAEYYTESDSIKIQSSHGEGGYQLNPEARIMAGVDYRDLRADEGSGLDRSDILKSSWNRDIWAGAGYLPWPELDLTARAGVAEQHTTNGVSDLFIYALAASYRPADPVRFMLAHGRDYYAVSPRAVYLGIDREATSFRMLWAPDLNYVVDASGEYDSYSDGNRSWTTVLAPRRAVLRSQRLNLDLGLYLTWLEFDHDPRNGYYAPTSYERYAVKADGYWKINDDNGVGLVFTAGEQKDNTMSHYNFSTSGDVHGQFGFYHDWVLQLHFGYTHNVNSATGNFDARIYGVSMEKRF